MIWIIATTDIVVSIGLLITPTIVIAKQDAWISMLVGGAMGVILTLLFVHLSILHHNQTLIQFSQTLLGKWMGRIIVLPYFMVWYLLSAFILRSFSDFIHFLLLDRTPVWLIMLLLICLIVYLTYTSRITGIGRFCAIVGPFMILVLIISFAFNAGNFELDHLLPVYADSGWVNILKGAVTPATFFVGPFVQLVIISFMQPPQKAYTSTLLGKGITVFMVFTATLVTLLVFPPSLAAKLRFSFFMSVKVIDILDFIQNTDILLTFIWIFAIFAELSLYLFVTSYEVANWLKLKDWRKVIWFSVTVTFIIAVLIPNEATINLFQNRIWTFIFFPVCGVVIPLFLWIITAIKSHSLQKRL